MRTLEIQKVTDYATAIHHGILRWVPTFLAVQKAPYGACTAVRQPDGLWELCVKVFRADGPSFTTSCPFNVDGPAVILDGKLLRWGFQRIASSVWVLDPSISVTDAYHGYIVVAQVPDPAPWIVLKRQPPPASGE